VVFSIKTSCRLISETVSDTAKVAVPLIAIHIRSFDWIGTTFDDLE